MFVGLPSRFDGIGGQISTAVPFNEIAAVYHLREFTFVAKGLKCLVLKIRPHIETTEAAIVCLKWLESNWVQV